MKLLFDLFPVILFFLTFKVAGMFPDAASGFASSVLGGGITPDQVPVLLATAVAIISSVVQVALVIARGKKVEPMLWMSLAIIVVFGGLTLWLHDATFIKWKPTILYWLFASILICGAATKRNFIQKLLGTQLALPAEVWNSLQNAWIVFFAAVGVANLAVAYSCSTETWVNFKLFGLMGLTFAFTIAMGFYIAKKSPEALEDKAGAAEESVRR